MEHKEKEVYLIGIGVGTRAGLTAEAEKLILNCDLCFGAKRMLFILKEIQIKESFVPFVQIEMYDAEKIATYLKEHKEWKQVCVLLSGDVGFYSGAKNLLKTLKDFQVTLVPGVSSISAFCAKMKIPWDHIAFASLHGRKMNVIAKIRRERCTFVLLDGENGLREFCKKLIYYHMTEVILHIGVDLGYPKECILHGSPEKIVGIDIGNLAVMIAENPTPDRRVCPMISDNEFIRGNVPMTKNEVRTLAIQKLEIEKESIVYDIGAGTGSVSIQAAVDYPDCNIYAIEQKKEAIDLIEQNKRKFAADNITIIYGKAPEILKDLPAPTHVFIGGSNGNLKLILDTIWKKNPNAIVVMAMVTLETAAEAVQMIREFGIQNEEIVQISTAYAKKTGQYHLMIGQNPVTLIRMALSL